MSFDGLFTYAMTKELRELLIGGRILKIHQPFINEVILTIRSAGKNHKLLLSAHPSYARAQITNESYENPKEPPMFCMLLRKHMEGHFIEDIYQKDFDRIIVIKIKGRNEIGDIAYKQLIIEVMGRHSNVILVDEARGVILDSIKHVSYAVNRHRAILPGHNYVWPPEQNKQNPIEATNDDVLRKIDFNSGKIDNQLVNQFAGISPLFAREVLNKAGIANRLTVPKAFIELVKQVHSNQITPTLMKSKQKEYFYLFPLTHIQGEARSFPTLSELLDHYYFGKADRDRVKQIGGDIEKFIHNELEKVEKKIEKLKETMLEAENSSIYQLYGELLTANLYAVKKGMKEISVLNYYDEDNKEVVIELNPNKTPSENAQAYFTKYQKSKNALIAVQEQIVKAEEERIYFEGLLQQMETAAPKDIEEIKEELQEEGYIRMKQKKTARKSQRQVPTIEKYYASNGTLILVGKNNKQNDYLTTKLARREEIWLHTKDIPGSHVVIQHNEPSVETIKEAAEIAAYYSKARDSSSVPVDYTKVKYVRKPSGAKPGFVIYDHQQTVYVTPSVERITVLKNAPEK
ncbi:NFACT RNA binding domain-containing protein [Caldibacillus lycopersici]|uniref:Rqc2 homolog RqcH n=1 Tax=Perspicuibacillus lycopersici TaxID=1325689 RepID=A0AAE3IQ61_9BACI|nr:NFACT RNA binding domain-containing protein [Perspicuibacillus lycopersici]MCU9612167.1 NFACT RNA binding domain-containing protein [Perspicuibacillus lycopersici]